MIDSSHSNPQPLGAFLLDTLAATTTAGDRHPVIRRDPDRQLATWVRAAVLERDAYTCQWFKGDHLTGEPLQVDHIVPWSAGGSDDTTNLRTLCAECNTTRSNYRTDTTWARALPIVRWCAYCLRSDIEDVYQATYCLGCRQQQPTPLTVIESNLAEQRRVSA